jgi:hypothetical protein
MSHKANIEIQEYLLQWQLALPNTLCLLVITYTDANIYISWCLLTYLNTIDLPFWNPLQLILYKSLYIFHRKLSNNCARMFSTRTCLSLFTPFSYMPLLLWTQEKYVIVYSSFPHTDPHSHTHTHTHTHTLTSVSWFRGETLLFHCGPDQIYFWNVICTRQFCAQYNTHIKSYHLYLIETFKEYLKAGN